MRRKLLGRLVTACLVMAACVPAGASAASDSYFAGNLSSGQGYSSGSAHSGVYYAEGDANHNAFCTSIGTGAGGYIQTPGLYQYPAACASSGGFAAQSYSGISGYVHGFVAANYGYSFIWSFNTGTHYSW